MGPVPALMGTVPLSLTLAQLASLWAFVSFPVSVGPYHSKPVSAVCVPTRGRVPTLIPASQPVDTNGTRGDGMFCCFTHEGASTQGSGHAVLDGFDMAAARMCAHGTPDSCVPHGEVHPTWGAQPIGRC